MEKIKIKDEKEKNEKKLKNKKKQKDLYNEENNNSIDESESQKGQEKDIKETKLYLKHKLDDKADFFFSDKKFSEMKLTPLTVECLEKQGFTISTEVQEKVIPIAKKGKDICALLKQALGRL